jgi:hypothetical protein
MSTRSFRAAALQAIVAWTPRRRACGSADPEPHQRARRNGKLADGGFA